MKDSGQRSDGDWRDANCVWLDARGLQRRFKEHVGRGIGTYVSALAGALDAEATIGRLRMFVERGADLASSVPRSRLLEAPAWPRGDGRLATQLRQHAVLAAWLSARRPAAVHFAAQTDAPALVAVPSIVTVHDVILHRAALTAAGAPADPVAAGRFRLARGLERLAIRRARRVIVPSRVTADELVATLGTPRRRIAVIPEAARPGFGPIPAGSDAAVRARLRLPARYVLHTGGADARKRLPDLVAAFDAVARDESDLGLVLVGPVGAGDGAPEVMRAIRDAAARDRILLTGVIDESEVPAVVRGAAALVLATRHEGFGLPVVEAFACGVPVVATAAPAVAEVAGDAALLVPVDRPGDLADALRQLFSDRALAADLRARGLTRAQQFRWSVAAVETLALYEEVSGQPLLAPPHA